MRIPNYLSPTSIALFYKDRQEFYIKYLADNKSPRMAQTEPMSVGSAFDAYIKTYLSEKLYGKTKAYKFEEIFESQVEKHNRDWAREHGLYIFECYKDSGALADLMLELEMAAIEPKFEFKIENDVKHESCPEGVPLLGKPDLYFVTSSGNQIIYDFKVNGYCGKSNQSPKPCYIKCRDGWKGDQTRTHNTTHKKAQIMKVGGIMIDVANQLEDVNLEWAEQLSVYSWLLGEPIGSDFIVGIDQIVSCGYNNGEKPKLRIASYRNKVSKQWQLQHFEKISKMWTIINSGHIFDDLSYEENKQKCKTLDEYHAAFNADTPNEKWYAKSIRG